MLLSRCFSPMKPDWSLLPKEILGHIVQHLPFIGDRLRFAAVCEAWRSAASENLDHLPRQHPFLLIGVPNERTDARGIYSLLHRRILSFRLPVPHAKRCCGSSDGWLALIGGDLSMTLFNPFSKKEISLPPMNTIPNPINDTLRYDTFIQKVVLSSNPSSTPNLLVMIIYSSQAKLALFRPGDRGWTAIDCQVDLFDDVMYHKGQFYAVNCWGEVAIWDVGSPNPSAVELAASPVENHNLIKRYLVEWKGELLQIIREIALESSESEDGLYSIHEFEWQSSDDEYDVYRTARFEVYELDSSGPVRWVEVTNLGDHIVFLGDNTSFSVSASDFLEARRNCIYFIDDLYKQNVRPGFYDVGVYNLEDGSTELCYSIHDPEMPPPIWISPTVCYSMT